MIEQTFVHIQGIGEKTERRIWEKGIRTWQDFLDHPRPVFSPGRDRMIKAELEESIKNINKPGYFQKKLPASQTWRLFGNYAHNTAYLDIETSGLSAEFNEITVIGLYDGITTQSFVSGFNLDEFEIAVADYDVLVTFNGAMFDLPFIRRAIPHVYLPPGHIDLRFILRRLGFHGGLKAIERETGITRNEDVDGLTGFDAVRLWHAWQQHGDRKALDTLVEYNRADIVNLKPLMEMAFTRLKQRLQVPN